MPPTSPAIHLDTPQLLQERSVSDLFPSTFGVAQKSMKPDDVATRTLTVSLAAYNPASGKPVFDDDGKSITLTRSFNFALLCAVLPTIDAHFAAMKQDIPALFALAVVDDAIAAGLKDIAARQKDFDTVVALRAKAVADATAALSKLLSTAQGDLGAQEINLKTWTGKTADDPDFSQRDATMEKDNKDIAESGVKIAAIQQQLTDLPEATQGLTFDDATRALIAAAEQADAAVASAKAPLDAAKTLVWVTLPAQWLPIARTLGVTDAAQSPTALMTKVTATDGTVSFVPMTRPDGI